MVPLFSLRVQPSIPPHRISGTVPVDRLRAPESTISIQGAPEYLEAGSVGVGSVGSVGVSP
jgi:hypothetical protein